ncbi:M23 family metallopeptidase [Candidatus Uhrbacteria bacterium UHB]|nr:M23 family metallopeptidase [Candidatus Uhrbacteria bacterium UHB]RIL00149.1 MAG: hypothetical protein DCC77_04655 [Candidatus Uhrbacteria bacterium]
MNRAVLWLLRCLQKAAENVWPSLKRAASGIGRLLVRVCILPLYKFFIIIRLRYSRLAIPAHGSFVYVASHRYLFHAIVAGMTVITIGLNLLGHTAKAQDIGQNSLLYAMVAGEDNRSTEESVNPDTLAHDTRHTAESSLVAIPDIDFMYDDVDEPPLTTVYAPGTLVANYAAHTPDEPAGPSSERTKTETYVVQHGDTLGVIAQRFGVNIGTILWANNRSETQYIRPGDTLRIPPVSGVLITTKKGDTLLSLANKYGSTVGEIIRANRLPQDETLPVGIEIVLPGGKPPVTPPSLASRMPPSYAKEPSATAPNPSIAKPPDDTSSNLPSGKLLWPTSGRVITQYYGWQHTGLDIDGHYDSPIYASHDGVITTAGWNKGGYGLQVVVTGGGVMTRYAHASKLFVNAGETVKKGQVLAMVGTTGRSTGTHLHYEVYINGKRVNPLAYVR